MPWPQFFAIRVIRRVLRRLASDEERKAVLLYILNEFNSVFLAGGIPQPPPMAGDTKSVPSFGTESVPYKRV